MIDFGDKDELDAWDDVDAPMVKLRVLQRVVESLQARRDSRHEARRLDALRLLAKLRDTGGVPPDRLDEVRHALEELA